MNRRLLIRGGPCGCVALLGQAAFPEPAGAHGLAGVGGLPIPTWLFAWGASIVLVASFAALATLWPEPRLTRAGERLIGTVPRLFEPLAGLLGIAGFALVVYSGFAGEQQEPTRNLAPIAIFVLFWVGLPVLSLLLGDVFRAVNPWRSLARSCVALARLAGARPRARWTYPAWLGRWPAAIGIFAFVWVELVLPGRDVPATLSRLALLCAATQLAGMAAFGVEAWERFADPFAVYLGLFARLSPLRFRDGRICLRPPLKGVIDLDIVPGTVALLTVMIGSTSFDGLSQTVGWIELLPDLQADLSALGAKASLMLLQTIGLLATIGVVGGIYRLGIRGMSGLAPDLSTRELSRRFAHTLVPIALAYVVAHYFTLLVYQSQALAYLVSDPLGHGSDLFGTAGATIDYSLLRPSQAWYVEVAALLAGHVAALVLAHEQAVGLFPTAWDASTARVGSGGTLVLDQRTEAAVRSQYWMLGVMVAFTCLGLWLLSQAA